MSLAKSRIAALVLSVSVFVKHGNWNGVHKYV